MSNQERTVASQDPARARAPGKHPPDEALAALLEDGAGAGAGAGADDRAVAATRRHVAGCPVCTSRLGELRALRLALRDAAVREAAPPRDLAPAALARLHLQRTTVSRLNELLGMLVGIARGLVAVLTGSGLERPGGPGTPPVSAPPRPSGAGGARG